MPLREKRVWLIPGQAIKVFLVVIVLTMVMMIVSSPAAVWNTVTEYRYTNSLSRTVDYNHQDMAKGANVVVNPMEDLGEFLGNRIDENIPDIGELKSLRRLLDNVIEVIEFNSTTPQSNVVVSRGNFSPLDVNRADFPVSKHTSTSTIGTSTSREFPGEHTGEAEKAQNLHSAPTQDIKFPVLYNGTLLHSKFHKEAEFLLAAGVYMNISRMVPPGDIPVHPLSAEEPYRSRLAKIQQACEKDPDGRAATLIDLKRIVFDDTRKILMCVVPKNACTSWKYIMWYLKGKSTLENAFKVPGSHLVLNYGKFKSIAKLDRASILWRLNTYTKFMVTRNPVDRLVSAHRNKFQVDPEQKSYNVAIGRRAAMESARVYLPGLEINWRRRSKSTIIQILRSRPDFQRLSEKDRETVVGIISEGYHGNAAFKDFVRFGVLEPTTLDVHWRPQHDLCNPCAINYDYIVRFDDLAHDSNRLLEWAQRDDPPEKRIYFPTRNSTVNNKIAQEEYDRLPADMRARLESIYKRDYTYFDYDLDVTLN